MIEFDKIESVVLHYLQGTITEDEMRTLSQWLGDADNKQLFFRMKDVYDMRKGGLYPDDKEMRNSWQRLASKMVGKRKTNDNRRWVVGFYKYAAVAVIFICLTLAVQMLFHEDKPSAMVYIELATESGQGMSRLTLPDGTKVTLNTATKIKFPDRFEGAVREVFLDGEAFFDVRHHAETPFVVHTDKQKITVLGTTFNVMDYSADDYAITTLTNGSVKLQPVLGSGAFAEEMILKPNQQVYLDKATQQVSLSDVKIDPNRTWVNKIYHFRDEPLNHIAQHLEKIYGIKINIAGEPLKKERYNGTFPTDMKIEDVLKIINFDKQFSYKIKDGTVNIWQ
jgi:ferric-dicitrate binding protein FerR (iron transport regulator)